MRTWIVLVGALALAGCATWFGPQAPAKVADGVLVDAQGMTLYTFDRDAGGRSACVAQCAVNWPPLAAPAEAKAPKDWSIIRRDDGASQWAYKGKPLYTWSKDAKPGDRTGDGFNNLWRLAKP